HESDNKPLPPPVRPPRPSVTVRVPAVTTASVVGTGAPPVGANRKRAAASCGRKGGKRQADEVVSSDSAEPLKTRKRRVRWELSLISDDEPNLTPSPPVPVTPAAKSSSGRKRATGAVEVKNTATGKNKLAKAPVKGPKTPTKQDLPSARRPKVTSTANLRFPEASPTGLRWEVADQAVERALGSIAEALKLVA
ncbi:hypothetical protein MMC07_009203, partial [Pseudocyphellaria aurata]|nr:hypothetical protein [Pseudocyphellaria aurata]